MGVAHAINLSLQAIAHGVGSYRDQKNQVGDKKLAIQTSRGRVNGCAPPTA